MAMWSCGFRCEENNKQATAPTNQADQNSRKCNDLNMNVKTFKLNHAHEGSQVHF